jgi:murein L,D-transpeptidase YcbB/YkuD
VACSLTPASALAGPTASEILQLRIGQVREGVPLEIGGELVASTVVLPDFYERRGFRPAWTEPSARQELLAALRACELDGLDPADYHVAAIEARLRDRASPEREADVDLLATDGVIRLANHLRFGKVDLLTLEPDWSFRPEEETELRADPAEALAKAVEKRAVAAGLDALRPSHWMYAGLRRALASYRAIESAGGWKRLPEGQILKPGAADPRLHALEQRLALEGDLVTARGEGPATYDSVLAAGVRRFQERHGLADDGILGGTTIRELNVPVSARITQLRISLERSRLLLHDLPERFVVVNIPAFRVLYVDAGRAQLVSKVMVGKPYTQTPIFRADMTYVVLNPSWTIPPGIMRREVIPGMKRDPDYLEKKGFVKVGNQIVQPPGPDNALGRIKLMFPNTHSVYLHDTPHRELFASDARAFSSGCIRVEKVEELTALALGDPVTWSPAKIEATIATGKTRNISLKRRLPVLLTYWTAVVDRSDGWPQFFRDAYGRDPAFAKALDRPFRESAREGRIRW